MIFLDLATGWFEICELPQSNPNSATASNIFNNVWLSRYPRPRKVIYDNGNEFKKDFLPLLEDFSIRPTPTTIENPQANAVLERIHQVLGNMLRTKELQQYNFNMDDPWTDILSHISWAIRSLYHTTLRATPGQLVFGRDMLLNIKFVANWNLINETKQRQVNRDNERENKSRIDHDFTVGEKVLVTSTRLQAKLNTPTRGPYNIIQTYTNGTVRIQNGIVTERINIRRLIPYTE